MYNNTEELKELKLNPLLAIDDNNYTQNYYWKVNPPHRCLKSLR